MLLINKGFYDYGWGYGDWDGWGLGYGDGVGGLEMGFWDGDFTGDGGLSGIDYEGGIVDRVYHNYLRRLKSEDLDKTEKNTDKEEGTENDNKTKKTKKPKREPAIEKFKSLKKLSLKDQREAVKKELEKLKFEVFQDKNYDTKEFRQSHKDEVYNTKWILRQYQVYRLVKLMKRLEKVQALKAARKA